MKTERPTIERVYLDFAALLAQRSTCERMHVGAVVTDEDMLQVLGVGYNGNAARFPNGCDHPELPGQCGCLHAELNALLKAPGTLPNKVLFVTHAPCLACAKATVNARVTRVVYQSAYRDDAGIRLLRLAGVEVVQL
jgi:dCMP deaminase